MNHEIVFFAVTRLPLQLKNEFDHAQYIFFTEVHSYINENPMYQKLNSFNHMLVNIVLVIRVDWMNLYENAKGFEKKIQKNWTSCSCCK
jgi:hypothetical protein